MKIKTAALCLNLFLFTWIFSSEGDAKVIGLFSWKSKSSLLSLLLPQIEGIDMNTAAANYEKGLKSSKNYQMYHDSLSGDRDIFRGLKGGQLLNLERNYNHKFRAAVIANRPSLMSLKDAADNNLYKRLLRADTEVYIVAAAKLTSYFQALLFQIPFQLG
jgi:hypothetical protein